MNWNIFKRVSFLDKLMFTKHLSIMVRSGVSLFESLETLADNVKEGYFKTVLDDVLKKIESGKSLNKALSSYPDVFDSFYVNLIKISEESGTLEGNLEFLSKQLDKDYSLKKKIQGALFYPAIIVTVALAGGAAVSLFILPKLADFSNSLDVELPLPSIILMAIAGIMEDYGILIFGGLFVLIIGFMLIVQTKLVKPIWHNFLLKIPLFGNLILYGQLARFTRNFGTLLQSGVPVPRALSTSSATLSNLTLSAHFETIEELLNQGRNIGDALESKNYSEIPGFVTRMIKIGEKTGNLEEVLIYISDFYEDEIDNITKNLTTTLEPALLIFIGLGVGFLALGVIGPIYELTGSITN